MPDPLELIAVEVSANLENLDTQMQGASRVVDVHAQRITQSVERSESAIVQSSARSGAAMEGTGRTTAMLGAQFSQMGQQVAAGGNALQAIAIQLPDIAYLLGSTGGAAGRLASFFGGPWGIALTTATAVAASLIPKIIGIGDAAEDAEPKVTQLESAIKRLRDENTKLGAEELAAANTQVRVAEANLSKAERALENVGGTQRDRLRRRRAAQEAVEAAQVELEGAKLEQRVAQIRQQNQERAEPAKSESSRTSRTGKTDAERAAEAAEKASQRLDEQYSKTLEQLQLEGRLAEIRAKGTDEAARTADIMEAQALLAAQFPNYDAARLKILQDIAAVNINAAYDRKAEEEQLKASLDNLKKEQDARKRAADELQRKQQQQIYTLANLYEDAFRGGTDAIWQDFKSIGLRVIAEVLARFTLAQISGSSFNLGDSITSAVSSVLPGFATGGSMTIGGRGGTDNNVLSMNGQPIARVSAGEVLSVANPNLSGARSGGSTIIQQSFTLDARGGITTPELLQYVNDTASEKAAQAGSASYRQSLKDAPAAAQNKNRYGS